MVFKEYIKELDRLYSVGNTTEHSFRGTLQSYLQSILSGYVVTNEPRRFQCGAPDYVITKGGMPVAFLEAKDINDADLDGRHKEHKEQFDRYKASLDGIIFTDYLDFHLYENGEYVDAVRVAETRGDHIVAIPGSEERLEAMVRHLVTHGKQKISSPAVLARQMAAKAHLLADAVNKTIVLDGEDGDGEVSTQLRAFREVLIHDLKAEEFADIYAQTIVYGMFTARLNDPTPEDFSRQEAADLIPKSNPFLRKIFQSIAVYDLDDSIAWIVDDLAAMFALTDAERIMRTYGRDGRHTDPIVHFYEDFLAEYDPKLRKARGVWYTPAPVVKFIVKSVDEILQKEFGLPRGLADDSTVKVSRAIEQSRDKRTTDGMKHEMVDVPRVQILDPATGTGTFLAEVIRQIRDKFNGLEGMWPSYVEKSLIPRIHGFEILMASYTIAHLKLSLTLKETGYNRQSNQRLNVFLTNSLEEATPRASTLFAKWLSDEADAASRIKTETPIMVTVGNPPYSGASQNKGKWIAGLMESYKMEPGGKESLKERNPKWLNDDYVKFIRLAQHYIEHNGEGIVAFINPHGYLDNPTFRGMRWNLLKTFDKVYTLDLHGNAKKNETCPDGSKDENVFDIMQGVSINFLVKTGKKAPVDLGKVFHMDLYGLRQQKYDFLDSSSLLSANYEEVHPKAPMYFFVPKDFGLETEYNKGFSISELFNLALLGPNSHRDDFAIAFEQEVAEKRIRDFFDKTLSDDTLRERYNLKDGRDWQLAKARSLSNGNEKPLRCLYRPFDYRYMLYGEYAFDYPRPLLNDNLQRNNLALIINKQNRDTVSVFVSSIPIGQHKIADPYDGSYCMPLWIYAGAGALDNDDKHVNFSDEVLEKIESCLGSSVSPQELFDYIYAVLHCNSFRQTYKEFLKSDFPRIPYPKDAEYFHCLAGKGTELRKLHLMEDAASWPMTVSFPIEGDNLVEKLEYKDGKTWINKSQYFGNVSELAWNFFIGGYQPAQKWLKDRKGRILDYQDILHYGHIIYAQTETDRIMKEIDEIYNA